MLKSTLICEDLLNSLVSVPNNGTPLRSTGPRWEGGIVALDVDFVVAGAGGGLAGAIRAAELGAQVVVIEANPHFRDGNNTAMSTAMIPGAGTRWQRSDGIDDSPQQFVDDIIRKTHGTADLGLARALAQVSPTLVTWLADSVGLPIELTTDFAYPGHSALRCHTIPRRSGSWLLRGLLERTNRLPSLDLMVPARVVDIAGLPEERVVVVEHPDGAHEEITARGVLLATNGFGGDAKLVRLHIPEMTQARYHGSAESRGDALRIGSHLGAHTAYLDAYQGHAALSDPYATLVGWATVLHGGILINLLGQRFGDETVGYSEFGHLELMQPEHAGILIFDRYIHDACLAFDDFRLTAESGALRWATSPAKLAELFQISTERLTATLDAVDAYATGNRVCPFGRTSWPHRLDRSDLVGVRVTAALFHTQGGLQVDQCARVQRTNGTTIPGIYASGGSASGISGVGAGGYLAGNGLLSALGLAYLAGECIARNLNGH